MSCYAAWQRGKSKKEQGKRTKPARYCSVDGCDKIHFGKGYCRPHYLQLAYTAPKRNGRNWSGKKPRPCAQCGEKFFPHSDAAKFCSIRCGAEFRKKPYILKKGYKKVLLPNHPRADKKGYVFEHIIIAEAKLGRPLRGQEEVHHKDLNKQNNRPSNLVVCKDHSEHMRHHHERPSNVSE